MSSDGKASSNFIWPPAIFASAALIGFILALIWPLPILDDAVSLARWTVRAVGALIVAAGVGLIMTAKGYFDRAGTSVKPTEPTTALVTDGIYRYTRNPMYLGMVAMLIGLGLAFLSAWFVLLAPIAIVAVYKLAIEREERYLTEKFGTAYTSYRARVRRWL